MIENDDSSNREKKIGVLFALSAFSFWGLVPIYYKAMGHVAPAEILCHRALWSVPLTALFITLGRHWPLILKALSRPRVYGTLAATASLVAVNWFTFIYAIDTQRVLHASLGYFINPLVNVLMGVVFLRERLRRPQIIAVLLATAGTANMALDIGYLPWISLVLAFTFATYGLLRKTVDIGPLGGLFAETCLISPFALVYVIWLSSHGNLAFGTIDTRTTLLLVSAGVVNTLPLLSFTTAARRLQYSTMGLLQYLTPSLQFVLAVFVYREPFSFSRALSFVFIWAGLAVFMTDSLSQQHKLRKLHGH